MEIEVPVDNVPFWKNKLAKFFLPKKKKRKEASQKAKIKTSNTVKDKSSKKLMSLVVMSGLVSVSIFFGFFGYYYRDKYEKTLGVPNLSEKNKDQAIIGDISQIMELPEGEIPIVAAVDDVEKIRKQALFPEAREDDQAIIYEQSNKVIIYRPNNGKIVDVFPFWLKNNEELEDNSPVAQAEKPKEDQVAIEQAVEIQGNEDRIDKRDNPPVVEEVVEKKEEKKVRVAVYNGTKTRGLSTKLADQISVSNANVDIVSKTSARGDYTKTIVIDLTGENADLVANIASLIDGDISTVFPADELTPEADILVIGGGAK